MSGRSEVLSGMPDSACSAETTGARRRHTRMTRSTNESRKITKDVMQQIRNRVMKRTRELT